MLWWFGAGRARERLAAFSIFGFRTPLTAGVHSAAYKERVTFGAVCRLSQGEWRRG